MLLPLLTHYLSPKDYGTLAIFQVFLALTIPLVGMSMQNNILRNFAKMSKGEMAKLIGSLISILCITTGILTVATLVWSASQGIIFGIPVWLFAILPLIAASSVLLAFLQTVLRNQDRLLLYGCFLVSNSLFNLVLSIIFVVVMGFGWLGRASGIAGSLICFGIVGLIALRRQRLLDFKFNRQIIKDVLEISLPLIPHAIGGIILTSSDRFFLDKMVNREVVGLYAVGYCFGMIVNIFVDSFSQAWSPWFFRQMACSTKQIQQKIVGYTYLSFGVFILIAFSVTGVSYVFLPYILSEKYQGASQFIFWIAGGYAFRGMYIMVSPYLFYAGKTNFLGVGTISIAMVNLILNYFLIRINGAIGAAQSTLISWMLLFLCTWANSARICRMPWLSYRKGT